MMKYSIDVHSEGTVTLCPVRPSLAYVILMSSIPLICLSLSLMGLFVVSLLISIFSSEPNKGAILFAIVIFSCASTAPMYALYSSLMIIYPCRWEFSLANSTCRRVFLGISWTRKIDIDNSILKIEPLYSRGSWGYRIKLKKEKSYNMMLIYGGIVGNKRSSEKKAMTVCTDLCKALGEMDICLDEKQWRGQEERRIKRRKKNKKGSPT